MPVLSLMRRQGAGGSGRWQQQRQKSSSRSCHVVAAVMSTWLKHRVWMLHKQQLPLQQEQQWWDLGIKQAQLVVLVMLMRRWLKQQQTQ